MKKLTNKYTLISVVFFVLLGIIILTTYIATSRIKKTDTHDVMQTDIVMALKDAAPLSSTSAVLNPITQQIPLSEDQKAITGVIQDVELLRTKQPFFNKAKNGDILVIYPHMTIIYDQATGNIIDMSSVDLMSQAKEILKKK